MTTDTRPLAVVFSEGSTASTDYFLFPYLERLGYRTTLVDSRVAPSEHFPVEGCRLVVISRYVSTQWLWVMEQLRRQGTKLVYFMDDDLFDLRALKGLPWGYRWKIFNRAYIHRRQLLKLCSEFWVSTAHLTEKYAGFHPVLLNPDASRITLASHDGISVCYHGTPNHRAEIEWLVPIIKTVQARADNVHFELFGAPAMNAILKGLPRVSVLQSMTWSNYCSFTSGQQRDLALAPLLPSVFNEARGATKFYDYARMGAVGLYSNRPPYRGFIHDGVDGVLLDNDPGRWVDAILNLVTDHAKRKRMAAHVRRRVELLNGKADSANTPRVLREGLTRIIHDGASRNRAVATRGRRVRDRRAEPRGLAPPSDFGELSRAAAVPVPLLDGDRRQGERRLSLTVC